MQGQPVKADLNILSITALSKLNLNCPFPLFISKKKNRL